MLLAHKGYGSWSSTGPRSPASRSPPTSSTPRRRRPPALGPARPWSPRAAAHPSRATPSTRPVTIAGTPRPTKHLDRLRTRRTVLDKIWSTPRPGGAEGPRRFSVDEIVRDDDGTVSGIRGHDEAGTHRDRARPRRRRRRRLELPRGPSRRTRALQREPQLQTKLLHVLERAARRRDAHLHTPTAGWGAFPTNDDLTLLVLGWPQAESSAYRRRRRRQLLKTLELVPDIAKRVSAATARALRRRRGPKKTSSAAYGPGWALVATPATSRTPSPPRASATPSETPSCAAPPSTTPSPAAAATTMPWPSYQQARDTHGPAHLRLTPSWPPRGPTRRVNSCSAPSTATTRPWTTSSAGRRHPVAIEFFDPTHIQQMTGAGPEVSWSVTVWARPAVPSVGVTTVARGSWCGRRRDRRGDRGAVPGT